MKILAVFLLIAAVLFAQSGKKKLTFDVVSIKPNNSGEFIWPIRELTRRVSVSNIQLRVLIAFAYGDPNPFSYLDTEITGLPDWANTARYDVEAKPEAGFIPTAQQRQEMLQSMLEDRFKLKLRRESKDRPIYALVVDGGGAKMKLSEDQTPFSLVPPPPGTPPQLPPGPLPAIAQGANQIRLSRAKMEAIAALLTPGAGRKVVDKTGLTGLYDGELKYYPISSQLPPGIEIDPNIPSLFDALREQLGLRLVPERGPVDTFVVESVQRPSEN